jgi:hypothetical protein
LLESETQASSPSYTFDLDCWESSSTLGEHISERLLLELDASSELATDGVLAPTLMTVFPEFVLPAGGKNRE